MIHGFRDTDDTDFQTQMNTDFKIPFICVAQHPRHLCSLKATDDTDFQTQMNTDIKNPVYLCCIASVSSVFLKGHR
jgi:hypothetical protein